MFWQPQALANLRDILANLYPLQTDARRVVSDAGLAPAKVAFETKAINNWFAILQEAAKHEGKVEDILVVALAEYPDNQALLMAVSGDVAPPIPAPEPTNWRGPKDRAQLERIIGAESSLVPISFLEEGLLAARSVAKIQRADGSSGTGFLISRSLIVTNHHVIPDVRTAETSVVMFQYQRSTDGSILDPDERRLVPSEFFVTSAEEDWTAVRVEGNPEEKWGTLSFSQSTVRRGDRVNIIQHPGGGYKQISFYFNVVVFVGNDRIQYLTDTLPGSSGAPVFDRHWNVVAVHHSGGWLSEPGVSAPGRLYYRNEGILTRVIIGRLGVGAVEKRQRPPKS
jgi:S1-C subfamily serine protease